MCWRRYAINVQRAVLVDVIKIFLYSVLSRVWAPSSSLSWNFANFEMILTTTGSWIRLRLRRDRIQLPVVIEIISKFAKFHEKGDECVHTLDGTECSALKVQRDIPIKLICSVSVWWVVRLARREWHRAVAWAKCAFPTVPTVTVPLGAPALADRAGVCRTPYSKPHAPSINRNLATLFYCDESTVSFSIAQHEIFDPTIGFDRLFRNFMGMVILSVLLCLFWNNPGFRNNEVNEMSTRLTSVSLVIICSMYNNVRHDWDFHF